MDSNHVPAGSIQRILGHESRTTTEIYLHKMGEADREAMANFGASYPKVSHKVSHNPENHSRFFGATCCNITPCARSSAWIERWSPEPKAAGSNPAGRTIYFSIT